MRLFGTMQSRLLGTFGLVIVLLGSVVGVALMGIRDAGGALKVTAEQRMVKLVTLGELEAIALQRAVTVRDLAVNEDLKVQGSLIADLKAIDVASARALDGLSSLASGVSEIETVERLRAESGAVASLAVELLKIIDEARFDDVKPFLLEKLRPQQAKLAASIRAAVDSSAASIREDAATTTGRVQKMGVILMAVFGAVALVAGAAAVWTSRSVVRTLGGEPAALAAVADRLAAGDFSHASPGVPGSVMASLEASRSSLAGLVRGIGHSVATIQDVVAEVASGNRNLSSRTEEQAASLQQTAASMEQMTAVVRQSEETARTATELASDASGAARQGGTVVGQVVERMSEIKASSSRIVEIIGVIDGIAFQTNILALNAAVEAARAGEQGRGFAVVASEVRTLAQRSAQASREIKQLITESVGRIEAGSTLVTDAGNTMDSLVTQVSRVAELFTEISAATREQSQGISQVNEAISSLDAMTQQNAALSNSGSQSADRLAEEARTLAQAVAVFRL